MSHGIYSVALALGAGLVAFVFSAWAVRGGLPPGAPPIADFAQQVVGQRYFLAAGWHWPILRAPALVSPWGVNVAFTDSIPLALLVAKLLRPALPQFDQVATIWLLLCWLLQPASAVFAMRSTGERGWLPGLTVAVMAASQPIFLISFWHPSLSSHFLLLVTTGLYFRITNRSSAAAIAAGCFLPMLLLVHPYILAMGAAILAAAPATLWFRDDKYWKMAAALIAAGCGSAAFIGILLGYTEGHSPGGYGLYSMNLAAPAYPIESSLVPGLRESTVDATGGQGYVYLGMGLLLMLTATFALCAAQIKSACRDHAGLTLTCILLFFLALSNRVYFGNYLLFALPAHVGPLQMLRASDRLFWPVSYILLIGCIVTLFAHRPKLAFFLLPCFTLLQFVDSSKIRGDDRASMKNAHAWLLDPDRLRSILQNESRLIVLPVFGCTPGQDMPLMQPLWVAAETQVATNTMYVARIVHFQPCDLKGSISSAPAKGDVVLIQPGFGPALDQAPWSASLCRQLSNYEVCMADVTKLAGLPRLRSVP